MNFRLALYLAAIAMMIAATATQATPNKLQNMRNRFHNMRHPTARGGFSPAYAQSSAAAAAGGGGGAAAAAAVDTGAGPYPSRFGPQSRYPSARYQAPAVEHEHFAPAAYHHPGSAEAGAAVSGGSAAATAAANSGASGASAGAASHTGGFERRQPRVRPHAARPAATTAAAAAAAAYQQPESFHHEPQMAHKGPHHQQQPAASFGRYPSMKSRYAPAAHVHPPVPRVSANPNAFRRGRFNGGASSSAAAAAGAGGAAAASSAAGGYGGVSGAAAARATAAASSAPAGYSAHELDQEETNEHYSEPETVNEYGAQTGVYANDGKGLVTSSYVRSTDNEESHEDGKEDDDHYYKAGSYGKTYDENEHEAYDNDDEDVLHTKNMYRARKGKTRYLKDASKTRRESGSRVLAKDRHSASYNKDTKKFKENVDKHFHKEGDGVLESGHSSEMSDFDDENEEAHDSRNLGNFIGVDGVHHARRPAFNPAAAAAASASKDGVSSSSSAGRR